MPASRPGRYRIHLHQSPAEATGPAPSGMAWYRLALADAVLGDSDGVDFVAPQGVLALDVPDPGLVNFIAMAVMDEIHERSRRRASLGLMDPNFFLSGASLDLDRENGQERLWVEWWGGDDFARLADRGRRALSAHAARVLDQTLPEAPPDPTRPPPRL